MIYATRRDGDRQTLIELPSEKHLKPNMRYVRSSIAHKWVKDGKPHETGLFVDDEGRVRYALAGKAAVSETERHWRCFHCDEVFTTEHAARLHFGETECQNPACQIKAGAEMSMLEALRRAEEEARKAVIAMHEEGTDGWTAFRRLEGRTKQNAEAAENLGYERGLRDGRREAENLLDIVNTALGRYSWYDDADERREPEAMANFLSAKISERISAALVAINASGTHADPCRAPDCDCSMGAAERCGRPGGAADPTRASGGGDG